MADAKRAGTTGKRRLWNLKACLLALAVFIWSLTLSGCGAGERAETEGTESGSQQDSGETEQAEEPSSQSAPKLSGLACMGQVQLEYAECFQIYNYEQDYQVLDVMGQERYLLVPEGKQAPEGIEEDMVILKMPLEHIYLAATSAMALFNRLDALDVIGFSGTDASGWYIEEAKRAMENGQILFAGKYSEPDYELLLDESCDLAVESTMILHTPKVKEQLESLGIPVFTDRSSYESKALGRTEWIKAYGALTGRQEEAEEFFAAQLEMLKAEGGSGFQDTGKTVAFFYISESGYAVVRKPADYVADMIQTAGGDYVFSGLVVDDSKSSSVNLSMEEFYALARDADYLIYNSTIQEPVNTMEELLSKNDMFAEFTAVNQGNVWCVGRNMYQETDITGEFILDVHRMLTGAAAEEMTFLTPVR